MTKAQRLDYGESLMTHAMVFQGVNLDGQWPAPCAGEWKTAGAKDAGEDGYYVMSDDWF